MKVDSQRMFDKLSSLCRRLLKGLFLDLYHCVVFCCCELFELRVWGIQSLGFLQEVRLFADKDKACRLPKGLSAVNLVVGRIGYAKYIDSYL